MLTPAFSCVPLHGLSFCRSIPACCSLDEPFFFSRDCTLGRLWFPCPVLELDHPPYVASNQATNQHVFLPTFSCVLLHDLFYRSIPACVEPWMSLFFFLPPVLVASTFSAVPPSPQCTLRTLLLLR
eukprot:g42183.t1